MTAGIVDTTTWMEVMEGTISKANQTHCKSVLQRFDLLYPSSADQQWAMQQLERFQLSHHISKDDCLIASVAYRLQFYPSITHNLKDMTPMIGSLAVKPYT